MKKRSAAPEPLRIRSVMVPLDGSPLAEQALPWAIAIARKARARLRLAMVHRLALLSPLADTVGLYTKVELAVRKSQRDYLHDTAGRVKAEAAIQVATAILEGEPAPALAGYAKETGADLVVMTTHGRGRLERAWLGSVTDELMRTLGVPMPVIRPGEREPRRLCWSGSWCRSMGRATPRPSCRSRARWPRSSTPRSRCGKWSSPSH